MEWKTTWNDALTSYLAPYHDLIGDKRTRTTFDETIRGIMGAGSLICQQIAVHSPVLATAKKGCTGYLAHPLGKSPLATTTHHPQAPGETARMHEDGSSAPRLLGKSDSDLETNALHCSTRDAAALAWGTLTPVLEAQIKDSCSQAKGRRPNDYLDQRDGDEQSALGRREDSRRTPETGHSCLQTNHSEVHEDGSHPPATRTEVVDLSAHSRRPDLGVRRAFRSPTSFFDRSLPSSSCE